MIVDQVTEVVKLPKNGLQPPPVMTNAFGTAAIRGVGKLGDNLVMILDVKNIFCEISRNDIA
jgi:purine-binding chemotaxis protein CheW